MSTKPLPLATSSTRDSFKRSGETHSACRRLNSDQNDKKMRKPTIHGGLDVNSLFERKLPGGRGT